MKKRGLGFKLTIFMLLICYIGMVLLSAASLLVSNKVLTKSSLGEIETITSREAERIDAWLESKVSYSEAFTAGLTLVGEHNNETVKPILQKHAAEHPNYLNVAMGLPSGHCLLAEGSTPDPSTGFTITERPWYQAALKDTEKVFITPPYKDVVSGSLCITLSKAVVRDNTVLGATALDISLDDLNKIVEETKIGEDSYAFLLDGEGNILIHPNEKYAPDADGNFKNIKDIDNGVYASLLQGADQNKTVNKDDKDKDDKVKDSEDGGIVELKDEHGKKYYFDNHTVGSTGWKLYTAIPKKVVTAPIDSLYLTVNLITVAVLIISGVAIYQIIRRSIVKPVRDITRAAQTISTGDINIDIGTADYKDEMKLMAESFNNMAEGIKEQSYVTKKIADGDLTVEIPIRSNEDIMGLSLRGLRNQLNNMIAEIAGAAEHISQSSSQISSNSQDLAQGATEQASSVEELSASMTEIVNQIKINEEKTSETNRVSQKISAHAQDGAEKMKGMVKAVDEINQSSDNISKIIKVIDDIAFQTNILALNAAVEAARAGQHGQGFAVVAEEVRTLAARSAEAANETTVLIEDSINKAVEGETMAADTDKALSNILRDLKVNLGLIEDITVATTEQSSVISQVHDGIEQVSQVVSSTAAISEESAAASEQLLADSIKLTKIVEMFKLSSEDLNKNQLESPLAIEEHAQNGSKKPSKTIDNDDPLGVNNKKGHDDSSKKNQDVEPFDKY